MRDKRALEIQEPGAAAACRMSDGAKGVEILPQAIGKTRAIIEIGAIKIINKVCYNTHETINNDFSEILLLVARNFARIYPPVANKGRLDNKNLVFFYCLDRLHNVKIIYIICYVEQLTKV